MQDIGAKGFSTGAVCRSFASTVKSIQTFARDDNLDPVDHFVGQEVATIANFLQMWLDEWNSRDGQEQYAGVTHYESGNEFKFQSDRDFVAQNRPRVAREAEQLMQSQLLNRVHISE